MLTRDEVQFFLDHEIERNPETQFAIIFRTNSGEQRAYSGNLFPDNGKNLELIPFKESRSRKVKSFHLDKVEWIGFPYQFPHIFHTDESEESIQCP